MPDGGMQIADSPSDYSAQPNHTAVKAGTNRTASRGAKTEAGYTSHPYAEAEIMGCALRQQASARIVKTSLRLQKDIHQSFIKH